MKDAIAEQAVHARDIPPPQDASELAAMVAWHAAFGAKGSRKGSSIFDIGPGYGRIFRLFAEIKRTTGISLPITTVFQAPTASEIAHILRTGEVPEFRPAIPFRAGSGMPPLFMLPGLGGSVVQMFDLARLIRYPGAIYLNQQRGLDERHPPHRTVKEMALFQLSAIRTIQPHGPYMLLGYSSGGMMAVEAARLLVAEGQAVPFVGLIETGLPEKLWTIRVRVRFFVRRAHHHAVKLRGMSLRDAGRYVADHAHSLCGRVGRLLGTDGGGWSPYRAEGLPPLLNELREANIEAVYGYRPRKFQGKVVIFQSDVGDPLSCKAAEVWPRFVSDIEVVPVSGSHETMMRGRNVETLATRISGALERACVTIPAKTGGPEVRTLSDSYAGTTD